MEWNLGGGAPIYAQLVEQLTLRIATGVYRPGERVPPVRELAMDAGVNPNTMQRALAELEREGLMISQRTAGRFVTEDETRIAAARQALADRQVTAFLAAMEALGLTSEEITALIASARREETK